MADFGSSMTDNESNPDNKSNIVESYYEQGAMSILFVCEIKKR